MSSLHLYDTLTRTTAPFKPLKKDEASIYLCGATVQAPPHIGHVRSGVNFDILRRWLTKSGYSVTFIRNVTDIDDKILHKAVHEEMPWWAVAMKYERAFADAYAALNVMPPTYEPRATGHVTQMIELMQKLIERGAAYAPGNGDVYLEVRKLTSYLTLSRQKLDDLQPAADADETYKKDPRDFALWKAAKPGDPSWPTPWGAGRPGWHLECSAMAHTYLGEAFDIHGGGLDLVFPHHENEIAQSEAAGYPFAKLWMHNAWVTASSMGALEESATAFRRIESFLQRSVEILGTEPTPVVNAAFVDAMNDDLAVPTALAGISESLRLGNTAITDGDKKAIAQHANEIRGALEVLGCDPFDSVFAQSGTTDLTAALDGTIKLALAQRTAARERKDFAASDAIRDGLAALGISIEDTAQGPRWSITSTPPIEGSK